MNIRVCAAVIRRNGKVLAATRPPGKSFAGRYEFPGGKFEPGETYSECIQREIREELNLNILPLDVMMMQTHRYPDKTVELFFIRCILPGQESEMKMMDGQTAEWVDSSVLKTLDFLEADTEFVRTYFEP